MIDVFPFHLHIFIKMQHTINNNFLWITNHTQKQTIIKHMYITLKVKRGQGSLQVNTNTLFLCSVVGLKSVGLCSVSKRTARKTHIIAIDYFTFRQV